jgi:anti-sigma regulatory factor (Ser/Thr protein kinase)
MSEAANAEGQMYGADRIRLFLEHNATRRATDIAANISEEVIAFRESRVLDDDLTCLVIKMDAEGKDRLAHHLTIDGSVDQLERLRNWLASALQAHFGADLSDHELFNVQLAVQEAATNIIFHGLLPGTSPQVDVEVCCAGSKLQVRLTYKGVPFSPKDVPPPSFDGSRDHGFGLFLIDQLMDDVAYAHTDGQNIVSLTKKMDKIKEQS